MTANDTHRNRPVSSGQSRERPLPRNGSQEVSSVQRPKITVRDLAQPLVRAAKDEFSPPNLWSQPQPTLQQVTDYALRGAWTPKEDGVIRFLGTIWAAMVLTPIALLKLIIHILERPSRVFGCALVIFLIYISF